MTLYIPTCIGIYLVTVSILAVILTLYDKCAAKNGTWRVKERTLLLVAVLGGSVAMITVMRIIKHKTKHLKFTLGIPAIIVIQIAIALFLYRWL